MTNIAIIPARGGSKGIKHKNLRTVGGISLIGRTVSAAIKSNVFDKVYLSSDCDEILAEGVKFGAIAIKRPSELAKDDTKTFDVVTDFLHSSQITQGTITHLQVTSPLRDELDIKNAMSLYKTGAFKSVISACTCTHHPYKSFSLDENKKIKPVSYISDFEKPRQVLPEMYRANGAIYINDIEKLLQSTGFFNDPMGFYFMSEEKSIDIDSLIDLKIANILLEG